MADIDPGLRREDEEQKVSLGEFVPINCETRHQLANGSVTQQTRERLGTMLVVKRADPSRPSRTAWTR